MHASFDLQYLGKEISTFHNKPSAEFDKIPMPLIKYAKYYLIKPLAIPQKLRFSK